MSVEVRDRWMVNNRVTYSNTLQYTPIVAMGPIKRVIPFALPITCHFNRFHYSYKIGYKPKVETLRLYKPMTSQPSYTLTPFDAQWRKVNASDGYALGRPMFFEAEGPPVVQDGRLYIQSCHVTASPSHTSEPRFTVIEKYGCMIDSKNSSQSRFISYGRNTIRFSVDAFVFSGASNKHMFMHCEMSMGTTTPTESEKSCSYNHKTRRWEELHGMDSVCSCCESRTCSSSPASTNKMVSSGSWSVDPEVIEAGEGASPVWTGIEERELMFSSLWREEEEEEPVLGAVPEVTVTESDPMRNSVEETEPRRIFENIFGFN
ncbi:zona pellucida sperm-binding protein 3-like isoform X2 [Engraulis encrasicolus]|uniref:zona pellucida sperm-binding protein 3-like isoform X2 n=1 Tax=Engraulis encrasicolus TaxID=184585 RepID=UPI002FD039A1